ncbi:hypothetical protein GCM10010425_23200 [Streptomyces spororaveus]
MSLPPEDLRAFLAPVDLLWARLDRPAARRLVEAAARSELARLAGFAGRADAPQVLADRIARRLEHQCNWAARSRTGGLADRSSPAPASEMQRRQMLRPGAARLRPGLPCCEDRQVDRRATRHAVAAAVDASMPSASEAERRAATDRQVHETGTAEPWMACLRCRGRPDPQRLVSQLRWCRVEVTVEAAGGRDGDV